MCIALHLHIHAECWAVCAARDNMLLSLRITTKRQQQHTTTLHGIMRNQNSPMEWNIESVSQVKPISQPWSYSLNCIDIHSIFIHRNCSLIFSKTKNHMTKSNLVSSTYYVVFVCVSELKRNIYANPVYANCIPNEFDVIIIMRVQTKYTLTHICRVCLCKMHVTNWHTHM